MGFNEMGFYEWAVVAGIFLVVAGIFIISLSIVGVDNSLGKIYTNLSVIRHDVEKINLVAQWDDPPNTRHLEQIERTVSRVEDFLREHTLLRNG